MLYDPVLSTGTASINPCRLGIQYSRTKSTLNSAHVGAQHEFFELPGGPTILAFGADYIQNKYSVDWSRHGPIGQRFLEPAGFG